MDCLAWGVSGARRCSSCSVWRHDHPGEVACTGCGRVLAAKHGYCRLCWQQARREAHTAGGLPRGAVSVFEARGWGRLTNGHQLFFDRMKLRRPESPAHPHGRRRGGPPKPPPAPAARPGPGPVQLRLLDPLRDYTRVDPDVDADPPNPWLAWALYRAHRLGEARGWKRGLRFDVARGLRIVLSVHAEGEIISYTAMFPALRALEISVERVGEVLAEMNVLVDDRRPSFETWLERKLDGLAGGIRDDVEAWLRTLHHGGPRTQARGPKAAWNFFARVRPVLTDWSANHHHLREITRDEVLAVLDDHHGTARSNLLVALRSLFGHCQRHKTIFRNPTARIKVGKHPYRVLQPLRPDEVDQTLTAATTPATRLLVTLAAVYGAPPGAARALRLDDVDLGNRRLLLADADRPIDEFTHQILTAWLEHRRARWPDTANPHLLINQQTATETGPVSNVWARKPVRGHTATLERLRQYRQLEEALTSGSDPLHVAAVFGLDPKTALRYTDAARQLLTTRTEEHSMGSSGTQGSDRPRNADDP